MESPPNRALVPQGYLGRLSHTQVPAQDAPGATQEFTKEYQDWVVAAVWAVAAYYVSVAHQNPSAQARSWGQCWIDTHTPPEALSIKAPERAHTLLWKSKCMLQNARTQVMEQLSLDPTLEQQFSLDLRDTRG